MLDYVYICIDVVAAVSRYTFISPAYLKQNNKRTGTRRVNPLVAHNIAKNTFILFSEEKCHPLLQKDSMSLQRAARGQMASRFESTDLSANSFALQFNTWVLFLSPSIFCQQPCKMRAGRLAPNKGLLKGQKCRNEVSCAHFNHKWIQYVHEKTLRGRFHTIAGDSFP